ncbi:DUF2062 domain-containing protein [uncultured Mucilaginibacter sp.]|uniref:DUF2062 domain-containing protein n=1 Tax=uncultured Mucilaginibacter sp. TaxID=797541 RepID=UPI0025E12E95|nr:DUF2062 domain-containing protein [uncultured Mucilaginibacter sp.]
MFVQQLTMQAFNKLRGLFAETITVCTAFAYAKPAWLRSLFSKQTLQKLGTQLYDPTQSDERKALSAAIGTLVGIMPIWGFQTLAVIALAMLFRLNKALVIIYSQVSFPPLMPLIIWLSYRTGEHLIANNPSAKLVTQLKQYLFGSITLALVAGTITFILTLTILKASKAFTRRRLSYGGHEKAIQPA